MLQDARAFAAACEELAEHLDATAARLDALPASADDLAKVMTAPAAEFEAFEALLFNHRHMPMIPGISGIPEIPASGSTRVDPTNEQNVLFVPAKDAHGQKGGPLL